MLIHPLIIGELACGHIGLRERTLLLLRQLPSCDVAEHEEVLALIQSRRIHGRGLGIVDVHLLASASLSRAPLWTQDRALARVARELGLAGEMRH